MKTTISKLPERVGFQLTVTATTTGRFRVVEKILAGGAEKVLNDRVMTLDDLTAELREWIADNQADCGLRHLDAGAGKST